MADFNVNHITGKQGQQGTVLAGITTVSSTGSMRIPSGPTEQRGGRGRMVLMGGYGNSPANSAQTQIQYLTIATTGNTSDFGDMRETRYVPAVCASSTRGIAAGGDATPSPASDYRSSIDYVTIPSQGGASEFGSLSVGNAYAVGLSDSTRGIIAGGNTPAMINLIEYVTIASTGDTSNFGDLTVGRGNCASCASPTRGIVFGGHRPSDSRDIIEYVTIATRGDAIDFGNLQNGSRQGAGLSNTTRGIHAGGITPTYFNVISYITISTLGDAIDFGDLIAAAGWLGSGASSTRGIWAGAYTPGANTNVIQYVTIASTGNTTDFGDVTGPALIGLGGLTDVHGGLGD